MFFTIVLDCSDGQLARLTGQASPLGRIVDGVCDFLWLLVFWLCLYFSGYFGNDHRILWLMILSGASEAVHCWRYDAAKMTFLELISETKESQDASDAIMLIKNSVRKYDVIGVVLGFFMYIQLYFFVRGNSKKKVYTLSEEQKIMVKDQLEDLVVLWTWLGESLHNTLLLISVMMMGFTKWPVIYVFLFFLFPLNIYQMFLEVRWYRALKRVRSQIQ